MKRIKYLVIIVLLGLILCGCSNSKIVDEETFSIDGQEQIIKTDNTEFDEPDNTKEESKQTEILTNAHENHGYDEDCEECPPLRITDGVEIDGPGGMNPNWPIESDNPNRWPKNMGDLDSEDQNLEIE